MKSINFFRILGFVGIVLLIVGVFNIILFAQTGSGNVAVYMNNGNIMSVSINATQYNLANTNVTDVLANPYQSVNFIMFTDGAGDYFGKNVVTGHIDFAYQNSSMTFNNIRGALGSFATGATGTIFVWNGTYNTDSPWILGKQTVIIANSGTFINLTANLATNQGVFIIDPTDLAFTCWGIEGFTVNLNHFNGNGIYSSHAENSGLSCREILNNNWIFNINAGYAGIDLTNLRRMQADNNRISGNSGNGIVLRSNENYSSDNKGDSVWSNTMVSAVGATSHALWIIGNSTSYSTANNVQFNKMQLVGSSGTDQVGLEIDQDWDIAFYSIDVENEGTCIELNSTRHVDFYSPTIPVALSTGFRFNITGTTQNTNVWGGDIFGASSCYGVYDDSTGYGYNAFWGTDFQSGQIYQLDTTKTSFYNCKGTYVPLSKVTTLPTSQTVWISGSTFYREDDLGNTVSDTNATTILNGARNALGTLANGASGTIMVQQGTYTLDSPFILGKQTSLICSTGTTFIATSNLASNGNCVVQIDPTDITTNWILENLVIDANSTSVNGVYSSNAEQSGEVCREQMINLEVKNTVLGYSGFDLTNVRRMYAVNLRVRGNNGNGIILRSEETLNPGNRGDSYWSDILISTGGLNTVGFQVIGNWTTLNTMGNSTSNNVVYDKLQVAGSSTQNETGISIAYDHDFTFYSPFIQGFQTCILLNTTTHVDFYDTCVPTKPSTGFCVNITGESGWNNFIGGNFYGGSSSYAVYDDSSTGTPTWAKPNTFNLCDLQSGQIYTLNHNVKFYNNQGYVTYAQGTTTTANNGTVITLIAGGHFGGGTALTPYIFVQSMNDTTTVAISAIAVNAYNFTLKITDFSQNAQTGQSLSWYAIGQP